MARTYRFGAFELHEPLFELRRGGVRVELQPKALDLLLHLLRHRDRMVPKDELLAHLWPDVAVSEASLSKAVSAARRAVGDSGETQAWIGTVRGRGFRFVGAVSEHEAPPANGARADDGAPAPDGGFVGRGDVLGAIAEAVAAADQGTGRVILLAGEAGMGKTRTAQEAAARARRAGCTVLTGWCAERAGAPTLWPWRQLLRQLAMDGERFSRAGALDGGPADLAELLPMVHRGERARHAPLDPEQAQFGLFETVIELLTHATRDATHLLVLDDFHWADRGSLRLLGFLAREVPRARLVLLVTHRADDLADGHPLLELSRRPECRALGLAGLDLADVARLAELETGQRVSAAVAGAIRDRTGGNPFFAKELARALAQRGDLSAVQSAPPSMPLPGGIREVLRQRLGRLSPTCRKTLVAAAAMGHELDVGVLASVVGEPAGALLERLDEAAAARVIEPGDGGYTFTHGLVRDALLAALSSAERARLHRRIGEAIEARGDPDAHLARLAYHFWEGAPSGGPERAIDYARRAGDRAAEMLAADAAAAHYRRALELEPRLAVRDDRLRGELLLGLGQAQVNAGQGQEGRETLRRAAHLARRLGRGDQLARAALASGGLELSTEFGVYDPDLVGLLEEALAALADAEGALRVRILVRLAIALIWTQDVDRCAELVAHAVATARRLDDPTALAYALYTHRWSLMGPDNLEPRLAASDEMLQRARQAAHRELELAARSCRFLDLVELGRIGEADRELAVYDRLALQLRVPRYRWRARVYRTMRVLLEGRFAEAEALAVQAMVEEDQFKPADAGQVFGTQLATVRREQDRADEMEGLLQSLVDRFAAAPGWRFALALAHAEMGRLADARDAFEAFAVDRFQAVPHDTLRLPSLVVLAEVCAQLGDAARAATLYEMLLPYAPRTVVFGAGVACWGALDRFLGSLAVTAGAADAAARHLEAALRLNTRMGARPWVGWTHHDLARLALLHGRRAEREPGRVHVAQARQTAEALGMTRLARHSAALAAQIEQGP